MITLDEFDFINNILIMFLFFIGSYVFYFLKKENQTHFKFRKYMQEHQLHKKSFTQNHQDFFSKYQRDKKKIN